MKAEFDGTGKLTLIPESPVEAFALGVWWRDYTSEKPEFAVLCVEEIKLETG